MLSKYLDNLTIIYSNSFHCASTFTSITQYQTIQSSLFFWQENMQLIEKQPLPFISKDHRSNADLLIPQEPPSYSLLFLNRKVQDEYSKPPKENQKDFMQQWLASFLFLPQLLAPEIIALHPRLQLYTRDIALHPRYSFILEFSPAEEIPSWTFRSHLLAPVTFYSHLQYRTLFIVTCHFNLPLFQLNKPKYSKEPVRISSIHI